MQSPYSLPSLPPQECKLLTFTGDLNVVTEVTSLAIDLDTVVEVLLESGGIEDTVVGGAREVDEELVGGLALLGATLGGLLNSLVSGKRKTNSRNRQGSVAVGTP